MKSRVFFSCFTSYQLVNALYYCMKVKWGDECEKILIWLNDTNSEIDIGFADKMFDRIFEIDSLPKVNFFRRQLVRCLSAGRFFSISKLGKFCKEKYKKNILICFNDQQYVTNKLIHVFSQMPSSDIVLIEEGVGTYVMGEKIQEDIPAQIVNFLWGLHSEPYIGANKNIHALIIKKPDEIPAQKTTGRVLIRKNNIFADESWIALFKERFLDNLVLEHSTKPRALWIGQPLGDFFLSKEEENKVLDRIFSVISKEYQVCIKPHPLDKSGRYTQFLEKYGILELRAGKYSWLPVEIIAQYLNAEIIMGPMSSALYNIYQSGVIGKYIYCYKLFGVTVGQDYFNNLASKKNIYVIESIEELPKVISFPIGHLDMDKELLNDDIQFLEDLLLT